MEPLPLSYARLEGEGSSIVRLFLVPVGWQTTAVAIASMLLFFWANRMPLAHPGYGLLAVLLWLLVVLLWLPRMLVQVVLVVFRMESATARMMRGWIIAPLILLLIYIVLRLELPLKAAIALSRPSMDRAVQQLIAPGATIPTSAPMGLYTAVLIEPIPDGVRFLCEGSGFFRAAGGFAYSPDGPPPPVDGYDQYEAIGDGWYIRRWIRD